MLTVFISLQANPTDETSPPSITSQVVTFPTAEGYDRAVKRLNATYEGANVTVHATVLKGEGE